VEGLFRAVHVVRTMLELMGRTKFDTTRPRVQRLLEWLE
jgi:hypothetical protein